MTQKFNSRVSAEGALLIADAVAKNTKMSFLKAYGSTTEFSDDQLAGLTDKDLTGASHNQTGHISNVAVDDATSTVHTEIVLDGNSVEADYGLNSILMVATVDGNEHLFAVLKANQVQYMNAYDGKSSTNLQINCSFKVSNTDVVDIIKVDTAGTLTRADYDKLHEFTVSQVAVTVTNVNKYTDTAMSKEAAARSAADSAENKARSDADTWETGQRTAADTTETNARIAADNAAASSVSKLTSTVAANYTSATVYADSAVAAEATAQSNAILSEAAARAAADTWESGQRAAADTWESGQRAAADSSEAKARSDADVAINTKVTANSAAAAKAQSTADGKSNKPVWIDNTDLNTLVTPGLFYCGSDSYAATVENKPYNSSFSLVILKNAGVTQIFANFWTSSAHIYFRNGYANDGVNYKWGTWHQAVMTDDDVDFLGNISFQQGVTTSTLKSTNSINVTAGGKGYHFDKNGDLTIPGRVLDKSLDVRNNDPIPNWYITNFPFARIREFHSTASVHLNSFDIQDAAWCEVETRIPYADGSGGYPIQTAYPTDSNGRPLIFVRKGTSLNDWSAWEQITTW